MFLKVLSNLEDYMKDNPSTGFSGVNGVCSRIQLAQVALVNKTSHFDIRTLSQVSGYPTQRVIC